MGKVTMFYRTVFFVCCIGFTLVKLVKTDPLNVTEITFKIGTKQEKDNVSSLLCDHVEGSHKYTALEGGEIQITARHNTFINHFLCTEYTNKTRNYSYVKTHLNSSVTVIKFFVEKEMGTLWNCTVLTNRYNPTMQPSVVYNNISYTAAYCYMKIHVRLVDMPQTILVNTMSHQAVRTDLSVSDVDFTAEYQYADGDVVNALCVNFLETASLTMEYPMADTLSDKFSSTNLSSSTAIGFSAKLHSGHNNSYMICTNMESNDYTKVKVTFVMGTEFNNVSIKINGMTLRPKLQNLQMNSYKIEYKYTSNKPIKVLCEVKRTDLKLVVSDESHFSGNQYNYNRTVLKPSKQDEMSFYLNGANKTLTCAADYIKKGEGSAEITKIKFSNGNFPTDPYPLHMELPRKGPVMELYESGDQSRNVIFYEFENNEKLQLKCGPLVTPETGPVLYLQLKDSRCKNISCNVEKNLNLTQEHDNSEIVCYLKEMTHTDYSKEDIVHKEIRVILRERAPTTTSTTTTTTTTTTARAVTTDTVRAVSGVPILGGENAGDSSNKFAILAGIAGLVICIIVICVAIVIITMRKRNHSQGNPHNRNYENLTTPSDTSTPAFPPQWESNYAVPVDRRTDDTTYSVPFQQPALYATPTPKKLRNNKQKPIEPTYAALQVPNARGGKNFFKETDDPNYSEVYAQEQCYAKVLPKGERNNVRQDNPYSYVTNEPSYTNAGEPEPMYSEPAVAAGGQYANLNNSHYANSNAQAAQEYSYVEPTYCEPQKRKKKN